MVIDTSALCAIFFDEPEAEAFKTCIDESPENLISSVTWVELSIVVRQRLGDEAETRALRRLRATGIEVVAVDADQAEAARQAFALFGRGRHKAALNFGDCFSYALARVRDRPLLFKGDDFAQTDIDNAIVR